MFTIQPLIEQNTEFCAVELRQPDGLFCYCCQVEALQREVCVRNTHWQQQRQREEDILSDLDSALFHCLVRVTEANSPQVSRGS